ncbi:MAG: hypothetical protein ABSB36_01975 [Candidatus Dormibacteria bacterium]
MPARDEMPPTPPVTAGSIPAWGMGDDRSGAVPVDGRPRGGGSPRPVGFSVSGLDAAILVAVLLIWTALFVYFFAQR